MSAEMIRTWRGRASASGSPAGITAARTSLLGQRRLLVAPVDVAPHALLERRRGRPAELGSARSLETTLPPKSPGRAGV
jgi:hypothetical protein